MYEAIQSLFIEAVFLLVRSMAHRIYTTIAAFLVLTAFAID